MTKMYIAVLDEFPTFMVPTLAAHAVLQHHLEANNHNGKYLDYYWKYQDWLTDSFKKVVLRVNQKEFDKISQLPDVTLSHENNTLEGKKACAVLVVGDDVPNVLKYAKMWEPAQSAGD